MTYRYWSDNDAKGSCTSCNRHVSAAGIAAHDVLVVYLRSTPRGGTVEFRFCADCVIEAWERRAGSTRGAFSGDLLDLLDGLTLEELYEEATR